MTRYLTLDEFTNLIGLDELSQIAGIGSHNTPEGRSLDQARIEEAILFSEQLLVSHARSRYPVIESLPIDKTPDLVKGFLADIARYRLRSRVGNQNQVSEEVRKRYDDAVGFFNRVARGLAELPIEGQPIDGEVAGGMMAAIPDGVADDILRGYR